MRQLFVVTLAAILGLALVACSGPAAPKVDRGAPAQSYSGGARLAFDQKSVDYGAVQFGQQVKATFNAKNVGDKPLTIRSVDVETVEGC